MPGQYFDAATGLFYNYYRDYDPQTGRYVESDPIGLRGGLNTYLYGKANPLTFTDALGLDPIGDALGGGGRSGGFQPVPGPFDVFFPGTQANQNFTSATTAAINKIKDLICKDGNDEECEKKYKQDLALCSAIASPRYGSRGYKICEKAANTRYSECLKDGPNGIRSPLSGVDTPL